MYSPNSNYLCHYGRKGMRWGEHIFESEHLGSYTRKGGKNWESKLSAYRNARNNARTTRKLYWQGLRRKSDYKAARKQVKAARKDANKAFRSLKKDMLADRGKQYLESGTTKVGLNKHALINTYVGTLAGTIGSSIMTAGLAYSGRIRAARVAALATAGFAKAHRTGTKAVAVYTIGKKHYGNKAIREYKRRQHS